MPKICDTTAVADRSRKSTIRWIASCNQPLAVMSELLRFEHGVDEVAEQPQGDDQRNPVERAHGRTSSRSHKTMPPQVSTARTIIRPRNHRSMTASGVIDGRDTALEGRIEAVNFLNTLLTGPGDEY